MVAGLNDTAELAERDSLHKNLKENSLDGGQENLFLFYFFHVHKVLQVLEVKSAATNI